MNAQRAVVIVALALMASLSVACQDQGLELALGTAQITVATSGADLDPDGYSVRVDGGSVQPVSINGTITLSALSAGDHAVALNGVAANCDLDPAGGRTGTHRRSRSRQLPVTVSRRTTLRRTYDVAS